MENATKALLMAGSILISIMVISFMVLLLRKGGQISSEYDSQISDQELAQFNSQFELYAKKDNTFFDIMTVSNLAWNVNKKNGYDPQNGVEIILYLNNSTNSNSSYQIRNDKALEKNYFFKGDTIDKIYFYEAKKDDKILVNAYHDENGQAKYDFLFDCTKIDYNNITGKVKSMKFQIK